MVPHQGLLCTKHLIIIIASLASCVHLRLKRGTESCLLGAPVYSGGRPQWALISGGPGIGRAGRVTGGLHAFPQRRSAGLALGPQQPRLSSATLPQQRLLGQEPALWPRRADNRGEVQSCRRLRQSPVPGTQLGHAGVVTMPPALRAGRLLAHICVPSAWLGFAHSVSLCGSRGEGLLVKVMKYVSHQTLCLLLG